MIISIIILIIGLMICGGGLYYLRKEKGDKDSGKIYSAVAFIGAVIMIGAVIKLCI